MWPKRGLPSVAFWRRSTTKSAYTRRWAIVHRWSLSSLWRMPLERGPRHERGTQRALGRERPAQRVPRYGAGSHRRPHGRGESADFPTGEWLGPELGACLAPATRARPRDPRCSNPAAETVVRYAIVPSRFGRFG